MVVTRPGPPPPECRVTVSDTTYRLDLDQAANAATIAAVASARRSARPRGDGCARCRAAGVEPAQPRLRRPRLGRSVPATTVARLGPRDQLLMPTYAAAAFYRELGRCPTGKRFPSTTPRRRCNAAARPRRTRSGRAWRATLRSACRPVSSPRGSPVGSLRPRREHTPDDVRCRAAEGDGRREPRRAAHADAVLGNRGVARHARTGVRVDRGRARRPAMDALIRAVGVPCRPPRRHCECCDASSHP